MSKKELDWKLAARFAELNCYLPQEWLSHFPPEALHAFYHKKAWLVVWRQAPDNVHFAILPDKRKPTP